MRHWQPDDECFADHLALSARPLSAPPDRRTGTTSRVARTGNSDRTRNPVRKEVNDMRTELARKLTASTAAGALGVLLLAAPALAQGQPRSERGAPQAGETVRGGGEIRGGGEMRRSGRTERGMQVGADTRSNVRANVEGNIRTRGDVRARGDVRVRSNVDSNVQRASGANGARRGAVTCAGVMSDGGIVTATRLFASGSASLIRMSLIRIMPMVTTTVTTPTPPPSPMRTAVTPTATIATARRRAAPAHLLPTRARMVQAGAATAGALPLGSAP